MKQLSSFLVSVTVLLAACNNNKSKDIATFTSEDGKEKVTVDMKQMQNAAEDMEKQKTELEKINISNAELFDEDANVCQRADITIARQIAQGLSTADFSPLPVLGVPGWWPNQDQTFYQDLTVFRPRRGT